jgi:ABC-type ATPase involved in cell division
VRIEHAWFKYAGADTWALEDIDVEIPAGTTTAIVGETGAGKTSLGYLVSRLYDVTKGRVTIDGVDLRELTFSSLAAAVGVVSQETYLFNATIRENLRFAKPDASDEEVEEAARAAQIHGLISTLPDGYETVVGERGYRFSGGEKQRIAIARAVPPQPADPRARRGDLRARHPDRARGAGGARAPRGRPDDDRDRPPALDHPRCRPDRRPRRRPRRRDGDARRAARRGGRYGALAARDADTVRLPDLAELA